MAYIQPSDLDWVGASTDMAVVAKLINKAEVRLAVALSARGASLSDLTLTDKLPLIQDVLENAVARVLRNPEGFRSESEGDYSYTLNSMDASGNIWFADSELEAIFPAPSSQYGSFRLGIPMAQF